MVQMTKSHHDDYGGYTLIEMDTDAVLGWKRGRIATGPCRFILPDILVEDVGIEELEEVSTMDMPLIGLLEVCPGLDGVYADACSRHGARVALTTNHYELPHDVWIAESSALGSVEYAIWPEKGEVRSKEGRCSFRIPDDPEGLRLAIRNALRNLTGQKDARLADPPPFCGPAMTSIAAWTIARLRPYAARVYEKWIERNLEAGYMDKRLVLRSHDVAGPCDRAEISWRPDRLSCTLDVGDVRFCEEVITAPAVTTTQLSERRDLPATDLCDHPALEGRVITGVRQSDRRSIHTLDRIDPMPLTIKVDPVPFAREEIDRILDDAIARFDHITPGARIALARMEESECASRITKVSERMISETPCQDLVRHDLRLTTDGRRLDCDGPIAPGVFWRKGAMRIEGLPIASSHSILKCGRGRPLRDFIIMPGLEDAVITSVTRAPEGKRRPEQIVVRAA
ncbi:hypothetical protein [uncultured Salinicola sp.]|uniref:hypothetical protein n=1 Tax=uncultured Salinicola sp. TaxID=1193542 RepID=UPI00260B68E5|nr:hypothetical protein [uncultured Salinicola sp.]